MINFMMVVGLMSIIKAVVNDIDGKNDIAEDGNER